jgi:hypothetical protein
MNVLNIPKQLDRELIYSHHAINRAEERCVPLPKYLPLNSECTKVDSQHDKLYYHIDYTFNDVKYRMVVSEDEVIITVYPLESSMTSELMEQMRLEYYRKKAYTVLGKLYDQMYMPSKKTVHETYGQTLTYAGNVICTLRELKQYDSFFA